MREIENKFKRTDLIRKKEKRDGKENRLTIRREMKEKQKGRFRKKGPKRSLFCIKEVTKRQHLLNQKYSEFHELRSLVAR